MTSGEASSRTKKNNVGDDEINQIVLSVSELTLKSA